MRIASAMILLGICAPGLRAQSPEFEVASIKVNRTGSGGSNFRGLRNGKLSATNVSLLMLLQSAYDLGGPRIIGPAWLDEDRYDVEAKSPEGVPDSQVMPMLQALLKDRFRVSVHRETREMPVYEMIVAKDGLKIKLFDPAQTLTSPRNMGGAVLMGVSTMEQIAKSMSASAGRPVVDKTGIDGKYSWVLMFTPLSAQSETPPDSAPDFFTAVERQLGLKLEPKKDAIEVLVIDHADRTPTEN
jgi:uncharacterized protein (TIGR03435 family)